MRSFTDTVGEGSTPPSEHAPGLRSEDRKGLLTLLPAGVIVDCVLIALPAGVVPTDVPVRGESSERDKAAR